MNLVKSFYYSLTNTSRPNIDFVNIGCLKFNQNFKGQIIILSFESKINIYLLQLNPLSFNLISCLKIYHEKLLTIEPINHIKFFEKNFPVISVVSNSEQYNENTISFYSILNNQKELKKLNKKYPISSVKFSAIYFGIGCVHGKIYIHSNINLDLIFKITTDLITKVGEIKETFGPTQTSIIFKQNLKKLKKEEKDDDNEDNNDDFVNVRSDFNEEKKEGKKRKQIVYHNILFDINNNSIVYQIIKNKIVKKEEKNIFEINIIEIISFHI